MRGCLPQRCMKKMAKTSPNMTSVASSLFPNPRGFSLLEIMIALTVFTIGILAVACMTGTGMKGITIAQQNIYASTAAARRIEDLLSRPYADELLTDPDNGYAPASPDHGPFALGSGVFATIEWEVDDDFPVPGTKRIRVTVRRPEWGRMHALTYEYVKAKDFR
jgi:type IV pilus assembly protein PilV